MKLSQASMLIFMLMSPCLSGCNQNSTTNNKVPHSVKITKPELKAVGLSQQYVGRIQSHHHIEVRSPAKGYLDAIHIQNGQAVKEGDLLFTIKPGLIPAEPAIGRIDNAVAVVSPFDGVAGSLTHAQGDPLLSGEPLTVLADDSLMYVYFNVPEQRYLEYKSAGQRKNTVDLNIELLLKDGKKFDHPGKLAVDGIDFRSGMGTFRADFPNPERVLHHGQTATVIVTQPPTDAIVVPQSAIFENRNKRFVYLVGDDGAAHQHEIEVQGEFDDSFIVKSGVSLDDQIVVNGIRQLKDGDIVR